MIRWEGTRSASIVARRFFKKKKIKKKRLGKKERGKLSQGRLREESNLLEVRIRPALRDGCALGSIVDTKIVIARSANGDGLDEASTGQEVQNGPSDPVGPGGVAGEGLALGIGVDPPLRGLASIIFAGESEKINVTEGEVSEVGQHGVGQLHRFFRQEIAGEHLLSWRHSFAIGLWED